MYIILTYDIKKKRVMKIMKRCRRDLFHRLESVFEGNLTEGQLNTLLKDLQSLVDKKEDKLVIYELLNEKVLKTHYLGVVSAIQVII